MMLSSDASRRLHSIADGAGPEVLCLHASGSSSTQWRRFTEAAQADFRVAALDLLGHGRSPEQPARYDLACESSAAWSTRLSSREPVHLVGHSYGGAVAIHLALEHPERIASLTVYEPVLFPLLDPSSPEHEEITGVGWGIVRDAGAGNLERAAAAFIDYWNGPGTWDALPPEHKERARGRIVPVARHFEALFGSGLTLARLHALHVPTLLLRGDRSPAAAREVCARLATFGCVAERILPGLGHMGPVTHPDAVNPAIVAHLAERAFLRSAA